MAFEIVEFRKPKTGMRSGRVRVGQHTIATFVRVDIEKHIAAGKVTVLIDRELQRIAFRKPRVGEKEQVFPAMTPKNKAFANVLRVPIRCAVEALGIDRAKVVGEYELMSKGDEFVYIVLGQKAK